MYLITVKYSQLILQIGNPAARWIKKRILIPHVGWPYALAEAKTCIDECVRDHPECQAITPYPIGCAPLPTRLIDCSDPDRLRIVETNSAMCGTYIALSYVWGERAPAYRTTEAKLSLYKVRIDPAELPQTILDAIHVTHALGIDLLWVDGLCIIQDSDQDMHHELARMQHVYRNAYVTIDAASAAKVSDGFLQDRDSLEFIPDAVLPFICPPGEPVEQPAGEAQLGMVYATLEGDFWYSTSENPDDPDNHTALRGWCLQERLLSTRSLVFTSRTLKLRCHTRTQNVGGAYHDKGGDTARLPKAVFYPDNHIACHSDDWKHIHETWLKIVCDYTRTKLSNPEDKLIAVSAVAEMFAPFLGPEYVAGLWRPCLLTELLWKLDGKTPCRRPTEYCGPSWSWASTDKPVLWYDDYMLGHSLAEVVKCTVILKNERLPFGPVIGASLILRSPIFPCKWLGDQDVDGPNYMQRLYVDYSLPAPFVLMSRIYGFDEDSALELLEAPEVWFVPLLWEQGKSSSSEYIGLIVTRADPDVWRRSGAQGQGDVYRRVDRSTCEITLDVKGRTGIEWTQVWATLTESLAADIELV